MEDKFRNRLKDESSPYLLQHANNPVDWFAWNEEAFEKAKKEDKPVFLSIGYSTCHWCHVMAHESFEDEEAAALMNEVFVSIKVDREERPDIDNIYMSVCQMMTGSGGWPLSIFMTPDKKPFYAGTYFPKENRYGRMGFVNLIKRIEELWKNDREEIVNSSNQAASALQQFSTESGGEKLDEKILDAGFGELRDRFDEEYGGFASAPKFPSPHNLLFLLRYWRENKSANALAMVEKTLTEMRRGGIYDHIGFGFHRYSTDKEWLVPHFEKMLYDQAMLAIAYTEAYQATKNGLFKQTALEILEYVSRDMTSQDGGFYSAEDADSEGVEGKFYIWTSDELKSFLSEDEFNLTKRIFTVAEEGNYIDEAARTKTGTNILHQKKAFKEIANELNIAEERLPDKISSIRKKIFEKRERRIHPSKDDKILTDWNGMMIAAYAKAARIFDDTELKDIAVKAADFVLNNMFNQKGRLLHRFKNGNAGISANIDDYAYFIFALLEIYEAGFETKYLTKAIALTKEALKYFWDEENGGFFFTASDSEKLLIRSKEFYDGAVPSGNSIMLNNLFMISRITGNNEFEVKAEKISAAASDNVARSPSAFSMMLAGLSSLMNPSFEIIFASKDIESAKEFIQKLNEIYLPNKVVVFVPQNENREELLKSAEYLKNYKMTNGKTTTYVCRNYSCELPTNSPENMMKQILEAVK